MRILPRPALLVTAWVLIGSSVASASQNDREYIFVDDEGHLVLRLVAAGPGELPPVQRNEVLNQEFSIMVHDRMHADLRFESEALDADWATTMEPRLQRLLGDAVADFPAVEVECRAVNCRILLEQAERFSITEHQQRIGQLQAIIESYIGANPSSFDPAFIMAGYEQASQTPMIKIFLQRAADAP